MVTYTAFNRAVPVTLSDTVNLDGTTYSAGTYAAPASAIYVGVTGDVVAVFSDGVARTFKAVPVGVLPIQPIRINNTSTTATNLVALYQA